MRPAPLRLLALLVLLLLTHRARAESHNGGAAIAMYPGGIRVPACVVPQPDSGALVLFQDTRSGIGEIYVQRVDRHGRPLLGAGGQLVWTNFGNNAINSFAPDGAGGCVFAWSQNRGATGMDILVQRVQANGTIAYPPSGLVVCNAAFDQSGPNIVTGSAGSYYVEWMDNRANDPTGADAYVQRLNLAGAPQFAANGIPINTPAFRTSQSNYAWVATDMLGGLLAAWPVGSSGGLRAQRVSSAGALQYSATGVPLADPTDYYTNIAPDGAGGLWAWTIRFSGTYQPFAHHLTPAGASSFAPAGIALHTGNANSYGVSLVRNASGGCFFILSPNTGAPPYESNLLRQEVDAAGNLLRGPNGDQIAYSMSLYSLIDAGSCVLLFTFNDDFSDGELHARVQRLAFDGTPSFPGLGVALGRDEPTRQETAFTGAALGSGLVMAALADGRYITPQRSTNYQVFGQALDAAGNPYWDDAEVPAITSAGDAPLDQGGQVRVAWGASAADSPSARTLAGYRAWRALGTAAPAGATAVRMASDTPFAMHGRTWLLHASQYWEMVGEAPAAQLATYALTVPTGQDSTAAGSADESFMVEAYDDSTHHWWSNALNAHSVDNVAPAAPAPFTGQYAGGNASLNWNPNSEPDLLGYRLYRGYSPGFVPGPSNLLAASPNVGYIDLGAAPAIYKLAAVDIHGNLSPFATVTPNGTLGVDGALPTRVAFALASANPARGGATLRLALPAPANARIAIYDAGGRQVRTLFDGARPAGTATYAWNGADAAGHALPSGLYFARLETAGSTLSVRLALTR